MFSRYSVKKPYTVIVGIILVIVLGVISFQHMSTDLLPNMNLPYVVVYTSYVGATPEQVENEVTRPMEASFATLTDVKKITSSSRDNVSVVIMQFNDGANMDTALIEISSQLDQLKGGWSDEIGAPVAMKLNPDMLPVAILSVSRDDMDILELSEYVEDELVPTFEALNGVASATTSGVIEQRIDVTIEQSRIDVLNSAILRDVNEELADAERELNDAQDELSDGRRKLARKKKETYRKLDDALESIENGQKQIGPAIEQLTQQREKLNAQREQLVASIAQLEALINMSDEQKAQLQAMRQQHVAMQLQLAELESQLAQAEAAAADTSALDEARAEIQAQRDALAAQLAQAQQYLSELSLLDTQALRAQIAEQEQRVASEEQAVAEAEAALAGLRDDRDALSKQIEGLIQRIQDLEGTDADSTEAPESTDSPESTATPGPTATPEPTGTPEPTATPEPMEMGELTIEFEEPDAPGLTFDFGDLELYGDTDSPGSTEAGIELQFNDQNDHSHGKSTAKPSKKPSKKSASAASGWRAVLGLNAARAEEADLDSLREQLRAAQARLEALDGAIAAQEEALAGLIKALEADRATLEQQRAALEQLIKDNEDISTRVEEAKRQIQALTERIAALDAELAALDEQKAALLATPEALRKGIAELSAQIEALEASDAYQALMMIVDPDGLNAKYAQAVEGLAELDAGLAQINETLAKLEKGIIPAGYVEGMDEDTNLLAARAELEDARSEADKAFTKAEKELEDGADELSKARKEFNEKRDEALDEAGLDGVITMQMMSGLIGAQNFAMPAGYVRDADNERVLVRVGDKFNSLDALKRLKLFNLGLDTIDEVRLLDVAAVTLADDRDDVFTKLNGADGILLSLDKQSTYSTADVSGTILARVDELTAANPNLHIVDLMNQGEYISIIVDSVLQNLLYGGGLAILVLLLFLMDIRPTITVAFSIPISVVIAFVCMYFSGITLNVLSLSGLSLGIGMLVDNSIVAIENIYRMHDEEGLPLLRACVEGVRTVSGALFASTLTTICVFLPIAFVQGMARDLFADMGLSIAYSLLASLFVAMTVVPAMCSFLMKHSKPHRHVIFGAIQRFYLWLLRGALHVRLLVLLAALGLLAYAGMQVPKMGISFMPEVNSRQMSADLSFAPEMTDAQQKAQAIAVMDGMLGVKGVSSVGLMSGSGGMLSSLSGGGGMSYYMLIDETAGRRNVDIAREITDIAEKLGADLSVSASTMDISMLTGSGISVEITGDDLEVLQSIAVDVAELARQTEGIDDVDDGLEDAVPEMRIQVDREKATDENLTTAQIFQFIAQKLAGRVEITKVTLDGKELSIYLEDGANKNLTPEDLEDLEIEVDTDDENKLVRIGDVASIRQTQSLSTINRDSQRRLVTVTFTIADGYSANLVSNDFEAKLKGYQVPDGYSVKMAGENETVMAIMEDLVWMVLVAVLLIFLIMVAQFQSFKSPVIVMFTIPLAFTGGLLALLLTRMDLSIVSMLGFLVLSGVVVNNGIVFIDCVNQLRIGGMEKRDALLEAGRVRLRPILMTALTTILGMSLMAMGNGTGAEMMQPMAVVSIGGLSYATLMTLFIVPVLYDLLNGKTLRAREVQMIREAAGMTGDEVFDADDRAGAPDAEPAANAHVPTPAAEAADAQGSMPVKSASPDAAESLPFPREVESPEETGAGAGATAETAPRESPPDSASTGAPALPGEIEIPAATVAEPPTRPDARPVRVRLAPRGGR